MISVWNYIRLAGCVALLGGFVAFGWTDRIGWVPTGIAIWLALAAAAYYLDPDVNRPPRASNTDPEIYAHDD